MMKLTRSLLALGALSLLAMPAMAEHGHTMVKKTVIKKGHGHSHAVKKVIVKKGHGHTTVVKKVVHH
jgi:hypothetical protein